MYIKKLKSKEDVNSWISLFPANITKYSYWRPDCDFAVGVSNSGGGGRRQQGQWPQLATVQPGTPLGACLVQEFQS